jgi:predicted nucleic acid-binding protein
MNGNVFVDTNILLYALTEPRKQSQSSDLEKRLKALEILTNLYNNAHIVISIQVLNELHLNMVRKFNIPDTVAFDTLQKNVFEIATIANLTSQTYRQAYTIRQRYSLSYWDSLIVASALENGCAALYSEDMQNGLVVEKTLTIVNPF